MFEQAFGCVLDVPVRPFGEHAPDGVVDLGEAVGKEKKGGVSVMSIDGKYGNGQGQGDGYDRWERRAGSQDRGLTDKQ